MEFEKFYRENKDLFYRWAYSYIQERESARDLVQEACMIVYQRWSSVKKMENAVGYMLRVIGNLAKKRTFWSRFLLFDDDKWEKFSTHMDIEERIDNAERERWIYEALNHVKNIEREVVLLRDVEMMDFAKLAKTLGINLSTAKSHYRRAKLKLLKKWEETYGKESM